MPKYSMTIGHFFRHFEFVIRFSLFELWNSSFPIAYLPIAYCLFPIFLANCLAWN